MLTHNLAILFALATVSVVSGNGFHHDDKLIIARRARPSNAAEFSKLNSTKQQCAYYDDPSMTKMLAKNSFPASNQIAHILDNDHEARALYNEIKDGIPKVSVRQGSSDHNSFGSNHYSGTDPDCWWSWTGCTKSKRSEIPPDLTQCQEPGTWGLTFDDGPYCAHNKLYDFLQKEKVRATMFFIGSNVRSYPFQAQRALTDGHDVCHHTWSHRLMTTLTNEQVFAELYYAGKIIKKVIGVTPLCWRPPQGDVDDRVRYIASALGMRTILWKEDTNDWNIQPDGSDSVATIDQNYRKIINKASNESPIVLSHELSSHTIDEFIKMYPHIKKGYRFVSPVSVCTGVRLPYKENIRYPSITEYATGNLIYGSLPSATQIQANSSAEFKPVSIYKQQHGFVPVRH